MKNVFRSAWVLSLGLASALAGAQPESGIRPQLNECRIENARTRIRYGRTTLNRENIDLLRVFGLGVACEGLRIEGIRLSARSQRGSSTVELMVNRRREGFSETFRQSSFGRSVMLQTGSFRNELGRDIRSLELMIQGELYIDTVELLVDPSSILSAYTERRLLGTLVPIGVTDLVNNSIRSFVFRVPDEDRRGRIRGMGPLQGLELTAKDDTFVISTLEIVFADGRWATLSSRAIRENRSLWVDFSMLNDEGGRRRGRRGERRGNRWREDSDHIVEVRVSGSKGNIFGTRARLEIKGVRY